MFELIPQSLCTALTGASSEMQRLGIRTERERERWVVDDDGQTEERERERGRDGDLDRMVLAWCSWLSGSGDQGASGLGWERAD